MVDDRDRVDGRRTGGSNTLLILLVVAVAALVLAFATGLINLSGGEAPRVAVEGGEVPEVNTGEVVVGTTETTVDVPDVDVDVTSEKTEVDVPVIGVRKAEEN